ncbi:PREDICTED: uncharacterized protein LOC108366117 [Rhagoletis zephyria]|uniref:uncharacterized protein LOC108366117 n=1 Tax=Rhagoletis zephyria TaxID=28612 RepID=UPI0008119778|nr:PREDICTED: uncharacterized protein LOC108366117 [Rhagoletis zephyria]XP_036327190.1 uncharacterized protein LOC118739789 [Rhagoletis pomonella]
MEDIIYFDDESQVEEVSNEQSQQWPQSSFHTSEAHTYSFPNRKTFVTSTPFKKRQFVQTATDEQEENNNNAASINITEQIIKNQQEILARLDHLENSFHKNMLDDGVIMAQNQTIRECKVMLSKVHRSVCRLTGEIEDELQVEIAATLPISSIDAAHDVEENLKNAKYVEAMKIYLFKLKGTKGSVDAVFKKLLTDDLLIVFNYDGRKNKKALNKLTLINDLLFEVFKSEGRLNFEKNLRKSVELSHNRFRQRKVLQGSKANI